ncbi:MAG: glycosyltransferase family 39 protein [Chloroflexi bacterium]|nr:glycosyltransferase family 39 protein [Chloroflexota bacterium]
MNTYTKWLAAIAILLIAAWLRVADLATLPPGLSDDEAISTLDAFHLTQSGRFPFYEDFGRPEPLYIFMEAGGALLFGSSIFAFRLSTVLVGILTVAATFWATRQCLIDLPQDARWIAGLAASASLAVALGHIALSRSLYRAIPQAFFMLLFVGFLLRGSRTGKRLDALWAGLSLGGALYSYTAAVPVPATLAPFALSLLAFKSKQWKTWLPALVIITVVVALLLAPLVPLLLAEPSRVIGRAAEVSESGGSAGGFVSRALQATAGFGKYFWRLYFGKGDGNPQYNVALTPVLPVLFNAVFLLGLAALVVRFRHASSWLIAALLFLVTLPVTMSNEIPHGLRIVGVFAVFPLVVGAGVGWGLTWRLPRLKELALTALAVITLTNVIVTRQTYIRYWQNPGTIPMFGRDMQLGEWFFRTDRREFSEWLAAQSGPLLVPLDELSQQTTRAWLMTAYPNVATADTTFAIPSEARVVISWALESGDYRRSTRNFGLLQNGTITVLPPFTAATHSALIASLDEAQAVNRRNGEPMAKVLAVEASQIEFETPARQGGLTSFGNGVHVVNWSGPTTLAGDVEQSVTYTVNWVTDMPQSHDYRSFIGLLTPDFERVAGADVEVWRWLFPTWAWQAHEVVPFPYTLNVPAGLAPGPYQLVVGLNGQTNQIGWVKVPQPSMPDEDAGQVRPKAVIGEAFKLYGASASMLPDGQIRLSLFWQSLVEQPELDATIFVHVQNEKNDLVAGQDARPDGYPTFIWSRGERVQTDYTLNLSGVSLDELKVSVGMYTLPSLTRLPVSQNGEMVADARVALGPLTELMTDGK